MRQELKQRWTLIRARLSLAQDIIPDNVHKQLRKKMWGLLWIIENRDMSKGTRWEKVHDELSHVAETITEERAKSKKTINAGKEK